MHGLYHISLYLNYRLGKNHTLEICTMTRLMTRMIGHWFVKTFHFNYAMPGFVTRLAHCTGAICRLNSLFQWSCDSIVLLPLLLWIKLAQIFCGYSGLSYMVQNVNFRSSSHYPTMFIVRLRSVESGGFLFVFRFGNHVFYQIKYSNIIYMLIQISMGSL